MFIENVLIPILLGTLSFIVWHWLLNPVLEFFQLRKEIHIDLIDMRNIQGVMHPNDEDRMWNSCQKIRSLFAQMTALDHSLGYYNPRAARFPRFILRRIFKMDIESAAKNLSHYSNALTTGLEGLRTEAQHEIEKALCLPLTDKPERVRSMNKIQGINMNRTG